MFQFFCLIRIDGIPYRLLASARNKHEATVSVKWMVQRRRNDISYETCELVRVFQLDGDTPDVRGGGEAWGAFQERELQDLRTNNGWPQPEDFEGGDKDPILIMHKPLPWGGKTPQWSTYANILLPTGVSHVPRTY